MIEFLLEMLYAAKGRPEDLQWRISRELRQAIVKQRDPNGYYIWHLNPTCDSERILGLPVVWDRSPGRLSIALEPVAVTTETIRLSLSMLEVSRD